jgi:hypothetical protein
MTVKSRMAKLPRAARIAVMLGASAIVARVRVKVK